MRAYLMDEGQQIRMIAPYVQEFLVAMKAEIPYRARDYDADSKHWLIDSEYEDALTETMSDYFTVERIVTTAEATRMVTAAINATARQRGPQSPPHSTEECTRRVRGIWREEAELYLLPGAPFSVIQAAYRAVSKLFHPDVTGSDGHARMVAINRAYDTLERRSKGVSA